jgi:hypothetical protein
MPRGAYVPCFTWRSPLMPKSRTDGQMREVVAGWARGANISDRSRQLTDTPAAFQDLLEIHRLQIAAISSEIDRAWQILKSSRALLQVAAVGSADGGEKTKARLLRRRARACMETTRRRHRALGQNASPRLRKSVSRFPKSITLAQCTPDRDRCRRYRARAGNASAAAGRVPGRQASAVPTNSACRHCPCRQP